MAGSVSRLLDRVLASIHERWQRLADVFLRGRLRKRQRRLEELTRLAPESFRNAISGAYQRLGLEIETELSTPVQSFADFVLVRGRPAVERILVQVRHYRKPEPGVVIVTEFANQIEAGGFPRGILVSCGSFTAEAKRFCEGNPRVELVEGKDVLALLDAKGPQRRKIRSSRQKRGGTISLPPACPHCGDQMVERTAGQGAAAGSSFWGCSGFPSCQGTLPMETLERITPLGR
jgi:restriction system protein